MADPEQQSIVRTPDHLMSVSTAKVLYGKGRKKSKNNMDTNSWFNNFIASCAVLCAATSSNIQLECSARIANILVISPVSTKWLPNASVNPTRKQTRTKKN